MKKAVLGLAFIIIFIALRGHAWGKDLHYGLSKWLAFKAGFSLDNAEIIALGTEAPDEGKLYPAVGAVIHAACTGRDKDLSKLVQQYHFPGYGPVPGQPSTRKVDPGIHDNASTDMVQKEVQAQLPHQPPDRTLTNLGVALHPLEDSWSRIAPFSVPKSSSGDTRPIATAGAVMMPTSPISMNRTLSKPLNAPMNSSLLSSRTIPSSNVTPGSFPLRSTL